MVNYEDFWKEHCGFNYLFGKAESNITEYKGETIHGIYKYDLEGKHTLKFKLIKSKNNIERGLRFFFDEYKGKIYDSNSKRIAKPRGKYGSLLLSESMWAENSNKEFITIWDLEDGYIKFLNCLYNDEFQTFITPDWGAMKIEKISPTVIRFYCNDETFDDDFDDLVFEMEILD